MENTWWSGQHVIYWLKHWSFVPMLLFLFLDGPRHLFTIDEKIKERVLVLKI